VIRTSKPAFSAADRSSPFFETAQPGIAASSAVVIHEVTGAGRFVPHAISITDEAKLLVTWLKGQAGMAPDKNTEQSHFWNQVHENK
jgi:hypothetical protein